MQQGKHAVIPQAIASLPWYDLTSTEQSLDQFWAVLAASLRDHGLSDIPQSLHRGTSLHNQWRHPRLLLSQCCGPDLFTPAASQLVAFARPVFADLSVESGNYFSHIVASDKYNGGTARLVVNSLSSRSGHGALLEWTKAQSIETSSLQVSGSHQASLSALSAGQADLAAIDAHSWNLMPAPSLPIIGRSAEALSPPYVAHQKQSQDLVRIGQALAQAIAHSGRLIAISDLLQTEKSDYLPILS